MVDLLGITQGMKDVNYVTPRIGMTPGGMPASQELTTNSAENQLRRQAMTENLFNTRYSEDANEGIGMRAAKFLGAAGVDITDMVAGSLVPGVDRGAVWGQMRDMGMNGLADFAARNRSGVELTSGIVGAVVTAGVADAFILPALGSRLAASTFLNQTKLWQTGSRFMSGAKFAATDSAVSAAIAGEMATVLGTTGGRALLRAKMAEGAARAVGQEAAVAAVTHSNQEMWSDDASTNLMMMAFGIGLGGALGGVGARYEMRQIANSDEVMRARGAASDPYGYTAIREIQPDKETLNTLAPKAEFKESVNTTALMLNARQTIPDDLPSNRKSILLQENEQFERQAMQSLQKITGKGVDLVPGSGFNLKSPSGRLAGEHLREALKADPTLLLGVDSLGLGKVGTLIDDRMAEIKRLRESTEISDIRRARELESQEALALVNNSWMPDSKQLRSLADYQPGRVELKKVSTQPGVYEFLVPLERGNTVKINEGGRIVGRDMESLPMGDQMRVYEGLNQMAGKMKASGNRYVLPKDASWLQMDFAKHFESIGGKVDFSSQAGFKTLEDVEVASLRAKADKAIGMQKEGKFGYWERMSLNLPLPSSLERIYDGSSGALSEVLNAAKSNANLTLAEAKQIRQQLLEASELRMGQREVLPEVSGDMFRFNRTKDGEWKDLVTGFASYNRVQPELIGSREHLVIASGEAKAFRVQQLRQGGFTKDLTDGLLSLPDFHASVSIRGLAADQVTGAGGAIDRGLGTMVTRQMRYRDSLTMTSAFKAREAVDRATDAYTNKFMQDHFQGIQNRLATTGNQGSKSLVNQFFSYAGGWDLKRAPRANGDGSFSFVLENTPRNQKRLGREIADGEVLMSPRTGKEVTLDGLGMEYVSAFQRAAKTVLRDTNAVRMARGLDPIQAKGWYVPPPSTKGKLVGFTLGPDGKAIPGGAIVAKTPEEFEAMRKLKIKELEEEGLGNRFFTQSEIESSADLYDMAEMGWVDPGFAGARKAGQTGSIFGNSMNEGALDESLQWVTERIKQNANGVVRSLYDQQLQIARARSLAMDAAIPTAGARRNIYDEWEATVLGKPLVSVKPGEGTKAVQAIERVAQSVINSGWPLAQAIGSTKVAQWTTDLAHRMGIKRIKGFKSFDELAEQLGDKSPYANVTEFMQANTRVSVPPEVAGIAQGINKFSATMLLRWFEFPNAAMNLIGIVTNMPSILRSPSTPLLGEMVGATGKKVGVVDSYKILAGGFKDMLAREKHADWAVMLKNGDTNQSVYELNTLMSNIESRSTFDRIMFGDKTVQTTGRVPRNVKQTGELLKNKGIDGMISLATDTTESMSRSWAHFIGLRLADANGIVGTEARHSFARDVANQAIANYNPLNKPELYQTSLGSMLGLFASYMQQYNQRLFRWMETGDYLSAGRQLAMQAGLFGVTSVPGYNAVESLFSGMGSNPEATLTDAIYAKYGPLVGSVVAHGGVQEIPKILGADESVAIFTRGDTNFRSPTLDPSRLMAGLGVVRSLAEGAWEVGQKAISSDDDFTARAVTEIIARQMPNRALKGTMQVLFNDGQEIDKNGQILSMPQSDFETSLRMLGLRSGRQQGEVEAYYANTTMRRKLAGRMETLRENTRSLLRSGEPFEPMDIFNRYVEAGGTPSHFQTWIKDQLGATQDTRGMRALTESLKSPKSQLEAWRYEVR